MIWGIPFIWFHNSILELDLIYLRMIRDSDFLNIKWNYNDVMNYSEYILVISDAII